MPVSILIHSCFSVAAFIVSFIVFWQAKGTKIHVFWGRIFWLSMFASAFSSFFIYEQKWSAIHIISSLVIYWLFRAVYVVRFKPKNWLFIHASSMGSAYIAIIIAGVGVLVRKVIIPGDVNAGFLASSIVAPPCIYFLNKLTARYKIKS